MARSQDHADWPTFDNTCHLESSRFVAWIRASLFKTIGLGCNLWLLPALQRFALCFKGWRDWPAIKSRKTVMRQAETFDSYRC